MKKDKRYGLNVALNREAREAIDAIAQTQTTPDKQVFAGDIARIAIEEYLKKQGISVEVKVDRGGYRGGPKEKRETAK